MEAKQTEDLFVCDKCCQIFDSGESVEIHREMCREKRSQFQMQNDRKHPEQKPVI